MEAESDPIEVGTAGMKNEYEESYEDPGMLLCFSENDQKKNNVFCVITEYIAHTLLDTLRMLLLL